MMKINLCPSMMCADYGNLDREVELLEKAGSDILHMDVKLCPVFWDGDAGYPAYMQDHQAEDRSPSDDRKSHAVY